MNGPFELSTVMGRGELAAGILGTIPAGGLGPRHIQGWFKTPLSDPRFGHLCTTY
jgi:hypothetical protein